MGRSSQVYQHPLVVSSSSVVASQIHLPLTIIDPPTVINIDWNLTAHELVQAIGIVLNLKAQYTSTHTDLKGIHKKHM